ncbi:AMP-binding protein [Pedobacter roseus]|uniref:AMP-binding protein n=1 Tax=Pedobacter roseus TaxID=336820 RepID=A0A7G9QKQ3_9SPHI|nr:AMP-binding protein [Pedobacter roseus]QNN43928.1 AMP-binding protein [Pedobacter roseus]
MIIDYLRNHVEQMPEKDAFIFLDEFNIEIERISYENLYSSVKSLAFLLQKYNITDAKALLIYEDARDFIICFLACQYLGITAVPLNYSRKSAHLKAILKDSNTDTIFTTEGTKLKLENIFSDQFAFNRNIIISTDSLEDNIVISDIPCALINDIALIQYTSGSTSIPKGVIITHDALIQNQISIADTFGCNRESIIFSWLPFYHDMGLIGNILHAIFIGCTCVAIAPSSFIRKPSNWLKAISKYRATHSGAPNFAYDLCVDYITKEEKADLNLESWKVAYNGAEDVRSETLERFVRYFSRCGFSKSAFTPCYGLAENTLLVSGKKKSKYPSIITASRSSAGSYTIKQKGLTRKYVSSGLVVSGVHVRLISGGGILL